MQLDYVEQRSADLAFYFFESQAPRESVRVLAERTLYLPGGRVTLAIIGSSHFLEIRAGDATLCELLACPRTGLDTASERIGMAGRSSYSHQTRRDSISYRFELWQRSYGAREFDRETARLSTEGPARLHYSFPGGDRSGSALTCLEWQLDGGRVTVATHHTFAGELTIVRTRSVIDFAEAGASP